MRALAITAVVFAAAAGVVQLARIDTGLFATFGPDRLIADANAGDTPDAATAARAALHWRPIDGTAYRIVALETPDARQRHRLLQRAIARWPRDPVARARLMGEAFDAHDFDAGMAQLDGLLRVAPALAPDVFALLVHDLATPAVRDALAARVATDPPWRNALASSLARPETDPAIALATLERLAAAAPATPQEVLAHADALERSGRAAEARATWSASVASGAPAPVFDRVSGARNPGPVCLARWRRRRRGRRSHAGGACASISMAARCATRTSRAPRTGAGPLSPAGRCRNDVPRHSRPFAWRVQCRGDGGARLGRTRLAGQRRCKRSTHLRRAAGCASQQLQLVHAARSLAEATLDGSLWLHEVGIVPTR